METFPTTIDLNHPIVKVPVFETLVVSFGRGLEQRAKMAPDPTYRFKCQLARLEVEDADTVLAFWLARSGSYDPFYFINAEEATRDKVWQAGHTYAAGEIVRPVAANGRSYRCTTAGASNVSEPTWPVTVNGAVSDGAAAWVENTYTVRFAEDEINQEYFQYGLYNFGTFELVQVRSYSGVYGS